MVRRLILVAGVGVVAAAGLVAVGCGSNTPPPAPVANTQASEKKPAGGSADEEHGHKPGEHGGIIVSLGRDSYHAEAVFEKGRKVRLYMLGKEETRIQEVDAQDLTAFVTPEGSTEAVQVKFKPEPQAGDAKGKTSLFVATLPEDMAGKKVQVTINNLTIGIERFRIGFTNEVLAHADTAMPAKKASDEERELFLTPGGKYTAADIQANGNTVPSVKFKGIRPSHDDNPKPGQKICPISKTVANPKFTWVIGAKTYEFCCTPCIEEFVDKAKVKPDTVKDPKDYVKQ